MRWKPVLSHPQLLIPTPAAWLIAVMMAGGMSTAYAQVVTTETSESQETTATLETLYPPKPKQPVVPQKTDDKNAPINIWSEIVTGRPERYVNFDYDVKVIKGGTTLTADHGEYKFLEDEVRAIGDVRINRYGDCYTGDTLKLRLDSNIGDVENPTYRLLRNNAHGAADKVDFTGEDQSTMHKATYTTCESTNPDWYLTANTLDLDNGLDTGTAKSSTIYFKDVPVLAWPSMTFPLSDLRHSGFLPPIIGTSGSGGVQIGLPYYWDIAPNRDVTFIPKWYAKRGLQLAADARYMGTDYNGETTLEFLRNDAQTNTDRYAWSSQQQWKLTPQTNLTWDLNGASDDNYPADFSNSITKTAIRLLPRDINLTYYGSFWNAGIHLSNFQVLQDLTNPSDYITRPYDRLPELSFNAAKQDVYGFDWVWNSTLTRFWHPTMVRGDRLLITPQLSFPIIGAAYFFTPKITLHAADYSVFDPNTGLSNDYHLNVPMYSLDSGLIFERPKQIFGHDMTQTLEPRLYYVYIPNRQQSQLPNFDSGLADFNFAQIFTENRFAGGDYVGDANQITAAVTTRFLESDGEERARFAVGQRFYFNEQQVQLPGSTTSGSRSDILFTAEGAISRQFKTELSLQYSQTNHQYMAEQFGMQWKPGPMKVLNVGYIYQQGTLEQIDVSGQWPLSKRWYGVARGNYSLSNRQIVDGLAGLEYKADCWVFRIAAQRFLTTSATSTTGYFMQLELNGLGKFGPNPLEAIKRNVSGYQNINN
jgi:LPS-assembly protein